MATSISKGKPVAVVYYRYDENETQTVHGHKYVHKGEFFVHNGVADEDLTPGKTAKDVLIRHVAKWPTPDQLRFCNENLANQSHGKPGPLYHYGPAVSGTLDKMDRLWVCTDIIAYSAAPAADERPVAYMVDNETNNASISGLELLKSGEFTIHYHHALNPKCTPDGRTAYDPAAFEVKSGTHSANKELAVKYV